MYKFRHRPKDTLEVEIDAPTHKDGFAALSQIDEVFGEAKCGQCNSENIYYKTRTPTAKQGKNKGKTFTYFEYVCRDCGCFLPLGQHNNDQGTLFPDRKVADKNGDLAYDNKHMGWRKPTLRKDADGEGDDEEFGG